MSQNSLSAPDPRAALVLAVIAAVPAFVIVSLAVVLNWGR